MKDTTLTVSTTDIETETVHSQTTIEGITKTESAEYATAFTSTDNFDGHLHLREPDGLMPLILKWISKQFGAGIIMPNTESKLTNYERVRLYRIATHRVIERNGFNFTPYFTFYLTDHTSPDEVERAFDDGLIEAVKGYPLLGTTGAEEGISDFRLIIPVCKRMAQKGIPLLLHPEAILRNVDPLFFEREYLKHPLEFLLNEVPELTIVLEHISARETAKFLVEKRKQGAKLFATITPQHVTHTHADIFQRGKPGDRNFRRGIRPKNWCMPMLKMEEDRQALLTLLAMGVTWIYAGTDCAGHRGLGSNPFAPGAKYIDCGCGGCFTAFSAIQQYTMAHEEAGAPGNLRNFLGKNALAVYPRVKPTGKKIVLKKHKTPIIVPNHDEDVEHFMGGEKLYWQVES